MVSAGAGNSPSAQDALAKNKGIDLAIRDPLLIDAWQTEIAPDQRKHYHQDDLSNDELRKSLNTAHDRIRQLTTANNQLVSRQTKLQQSKLWGTIWNRVLGASVVGAWAVILILLKIVLEKSR